METDAFKDQLDRIEKLLTVIAKSVSASVMAEELREPKMAKLYELTGTVTADDAAKQLSCSKTTVSDAWKRWERLGLVVTSGRRYERVF